MSVKQRIDGGVTTELKANKALCHPDKPLYAKNKCRYVKKYEPLNR